MRLFVAIDIDNRPLLNTLSHLQAALVTLGRPIVLSNIHLTLFFIGEVSAARSSAIAKGLSAFRFSSFEMRLQGVDVFPNLSSPRVVWVGFDDKSQVALINLAAQLSDILQPLQLQQRGSFRPHVTMFRIAKGRERLPAILAPYQQRQWGSQKVQVISLKRSTLTSQGARYSNLTTITAQP